MTGSSISDAAEGKVTAAIAREVPLGRLVGLDMSPDMIRYARTHYPIGEYPNLEFVKGDMRTIKYFQQFDRVFSNAAMHWVNDHPAVLRGIYRSLVPGGNPGSGLPGRIVLPEKKATGLPLFGQ